jgi:hypothetical protein
MPGRTMRRVGWANEPSGAWGLTTPRAVYEALAPLACGHCRREIAVGEAFTRRRLVGQGSPAPVCRACAPFAEAV